MEANNLVLADIIDINEVWKRLSLNFDEIALQHMPYHTKIAKELYNILVTSALHSSTNIILYGAKGFPLNLLWESVFQRNFGKDFHKNMLVWKNQITYYETPYFFEVDVGDPQQPKDVDMLSNFIKDIVQHPGVFNMRHIIIINNIDQLCHKKSTFAFRVLLERYSSNVLFLCTTHNMSAIEKPLLSRCMDFRIPLATISEIELILRNLELAFNEDLRTHNCRDLYNAVYIGWLTKYAPSSIPSDFCKYKIRGMEEILNRKTLSMEDVRQFTSQISVHDISIRDIALDICIHTKNKNKTELFDYAAVIDHMCSTTEGYRKPLYIELFLNVALFGLGREYFRKELGLLSNN